MKNLILCPLKPELIALLKYFKSHDEFSIFDHKVGRVTSYEVPELKAIVATGGHGKVHYALTAQEIIMENPSLETLICLGSGGSLFKTATPLDVVVATKTVEHDYRSSFQNNNERPTFASGLPITQKSDLNFEEFSVHSGPIASGDEDVITAERAAEIAQTTGALAVAWEGAGGARAAQRHNLRFIEIRGITDTADNMTYDDFKKNLDIAMDHAAQVTVALIKYLNRSN